MSVSPSQPADTQDGESAFGSDSSSVLDWKPSEPIAPAPPTRKALSAISVQVRNKEQRLSEDRQQSVSSDNKN